jgi:hypothetical protein
MHERLVDPTVDTGRGSNMPEAFRFGGINDRKFIAGDELRFDR